MSRKEKITLAVLVLALLCWSFAQPFCKALGLSTPGKILNTPFIALAAGAALFLIPVGVEDGKIHFALDWKTGIRAINWDIIIFITGALLLGQVMTDSHIDKWLGGMVSGLLTGLSPLLVWLALITVCAVAAQVINPVAIISLFVPMSAAVAAQNGLNPVVVCVTVGMAANVSIMFPFSSPPMAAALLGSEGRVESRDFFRVSIPLIVLCVLLVWLVGITLGPVVFPA